MKLDSKDVNISFYKVFLKMMVAELYSNQKLINSKVIIEDLKFFR